MPSQQKIRFKHTKHSVNTTKVENRKILKLTKKLKKVCKIFTSFVQNLHTAFKAFIFLVSRRGDQKGYCCKKTTPKNIVL
jgi:hypothetical protein